MDMFASEENVRALSDLGLSPNQAKVYLSVLQTEGLPVHDISKIAKVNREDVYRVILRLEKMGLIEKILGNPMSATVARGSGAVQLDQG